MTDLHVDGRGWVGGRGRHGFQCLVHEDVSANEIDRVVVIGEEAAAAAAAAAGGGGRTTNALARPVKEFSRDIRTSTKKPNEIQ